ncbi:MAG: hypothetical protein IKF90_25160 [Parasporobacterium sp.]|nr:hypothetical protein [Parasporobacterium sp.]
MSVNLTMKESSYISQVIYRINLCDSFEDLSRILLSQIRTLIPYRKAMALKVTSKTGKYIYEDPFFVGTENEEFDETKFVEGTYRSIWWEYLEAPWSSVFRATDSREEEEWIKSALYREIYKPQKLYYALQSTFVRNDVKLGMIGLYRRKEDGDFTDKELFFMELLKVHIELKLFRLVTRYRGFKADPNAPGFSVPKALINDYSLTRREEEVINMMLNGATDSVIQDELCITKSTFEKHIHNIYKKTSAKNRVSLFNLFRN